MSYFSLQSKSHLLSYQIENISLAAIIHKKIINPFYLYWKEIMFIKLNKNTLYVNFIKHKREYIVIPIIPIGRTFTFKTKQPYSSLYWQKYNRKNF